MCAGSVTENTPNSQQFIRSICPISQNMIFWREKTCWASVVRASKYCIKSNDWFLQRIFWDFFCFRIEIEWIFSIFLHDISFIRFFPHFQASDTWNWRQNWLNFCLNTEPQKSRMIPEKIKCPVLSIFWLFILMSTNEMTSMSNT